MKTNEHSERPLYDIDTRRGVMRWLYRQTLFLFVLAMLLFYSAGTLDWPLGWLEVCLYTFITIVQAVILIPRLPDLLVERSRAQEGTKEWDTLLVSLAATIFPMIVWVVAGLNARFGWKPPMPPWLVVAGVIAWLLGYALLIWCMLSNRFFSATVRIQTERGHQVVSDGPYAIVRHPGYVGAIVFQVATPFLLGSWWALIPGLLSALSYGVRTAFEDRTLQEELDGYRQYAARVRYRLIPGIW